MKRPARCIFALLLSGWFACRPNAKFAQDSKQSMAMEFEVIPEDYERNLYYVSWDDTLGLSEGYKGKNFIKRPLEVWCMITHGLQDTAGYYWGSSMAHTYAAFQTTDSLVTLQFMVGLNIFSDKFENTKNVAALEESVRTYSKQKKLPLVFEPLQINLKTDLRKKFKVVLKEK